jgi:hypothetical protein
VTNLQADAQRVPAAVLQRIWFFAPIAAGGLLSVLLTGGVLVPMGMQLNKDQQRLAELEALEDQVVLLRRELSTLNENRDQAQRPAIATWAPSWPSWKAKPMPAG